MPKREKSRFVIGLLLILLTVSPILTAFEKETLAQQLPKKWTIGTLPSGGVMYTEAAAFAKLISGKTPLFCVIVPYSSTAAASMAMLEKQVDMVTQSNVGTWMMAKGIGTPEGKPEFFIRVAQAGAPLQFGPVVRRNSGMVTVKDMRGKRVARMANPMQRLEADFSLYNAGLTWKDVIEVPCASSYESAKLLMDGTVDVAHHAIGGSDVVAADVAIKGGVRHLSHDPTPAAVAKAIEKSGPFTVSLRKAGFAAGIVEDTFVEDVTQYLVTHPGAPDQVIYLIVKALFENYKELGPVHPVLKEWTPERFVHVSGLGAPYHPGAIKFYKEAGLWTEEAQKGHDKLLKEWRQEK